MSTLLLADAKAHMRVTIDDDDTVIQNKINAAETWLGLFLGSALSTFAVTLGAAVNAGSFTVDTVYVIQSIGTTDFTLVGASANCIGVTFTATGVGSGTGTAAPQTSGPLPDPLLEADRQLVAFLYDNREAAVVGNTITITQMTPGFFDLLAPYRDYVF
jgi:Phage gp6-like head-tail connector protein